MALDYLCFAGNTIANNCSAIAYAHNGFSSYPVRGCGCCDNLDLALEETYTTPAADDAPWIDIAEPDSVDFGGLLVTDITGLDTAPFSRTVLDVAQGGAALGRGRYGARTITVTGVLLGSTCCAVDYGLRWLSSVLRGSCDPTSGAIRCAGDDLVYYRCCPVCPTPEIPASVVECFAPYRRTLHRVALVSGPDVVSRQGAGCGKCNACPVVTVEFTLVAGEPYAYADPTTIVTGATFGQVDPPDCPVWNPVPEGVACAASDPCALPPDCALDPDCPQPIAPPSIPLVLNPCSCNPLNRSIVCADIPAGTFSETAEGVPVIELYAGARALRNVVVTFFTNPLSIPPDQLDPCSACAQVTIAYIPPSGTLVMDGTTKRATITCPGGSPTPASTIVGGGARPFTWPTLDCGSVPYSVCVTVSSETVSPDTAFTLRVVARDV